MQLLELDKPVKLPPQPWCKGYEMRCQKGHLIGSFRRDVDFHREPLRPSMIEFAVGQEVTDERQAMICHVCGSKVPMPPPPRTVAPAELVGDIRENKEHAGLEIICKDIADYLVKQYPDWLWAIRPSQRRGMISIYNLQLSGHYAFHIRMDDIQNDTRLKRAKQGAGELLERFNMPRGRMDPIKLAALPRDFAGNPIPDLGDKTKLTKNERLGQLMRAGELRFYSNGRQRFARVGGGKTDVQAEKSLILTGGR